jgi:membrane-associated protease RseP (regulator of RpoE activity)
MTEAADKISRREVIIAVLLFFLTVLSTLLVGAYHYGYDPLRNPQALIKGLGFSLSILIILLSHELGHFIAARQYHLKVSLPYFLPVPHPLIGTMGAFIRIRSPIPNRQALIRIGFSGPVVGFLATLPITIIGLKLSKVTLVSEISGGIKVGSSLLFYLLSRVFFQKVNSGFEIVLHPIAFAGWLGILVTSLNLLPLGQLDGGHIFYGWLGEKVKYLRIGVLLVLAVLGIFWPGWYFWILLNILLGLKHPSPQKPGEGLTRKEKLLGSLTIIILILTFIPVPIRII